MHIVCIILHVIQARDNQVLEMEESTTVYTYINMNMLRKKGINDGSIEISDIDNTEMNM